MDNNKEIAKNTILLYFRQFFILIIGLYTSRIVLKALGVTDYGIYNVVGGVIALFGFVTNAMSNATSRYIAFAVGQNDVQIRKETFGTILTIYYIIALIIFLLGETLGLWFVYTYLVIPSERFIAALWVYHLSVFAAVMNVLYIPYNGLIIAHERMTAFAYISIMDAVLKLVIVYILLITPFDRLILYSILIFIIQCIDRFAYIIYTKKRFIETYAKPMYKAKLFKEILVFSGWTLNGNIAVVCYSQGINVLLNIFFGPVVNAARGIATQVQNVTLNFVSGFQTAVYPQITKSYAQGNLSRLYSLLHASCRISYYLMFLLALPFILKSSYILRIWLQIVPDYTTPFLCLILVFSLLRSLTNPINYAVQATGNIKKYQLVEGSLGLLILPLAYLSLKCDQTDPINVYLIMVLVEFITVFVRIYIGITQIKDSLWFFYKEVVVRILIITVIGVSFPWIVAHSTEEDLWGIILTLMSIILWTIPVVYFYGLKHAERNMIHQFVIKHLKSNKE